MPSPLPGSRHGLAQAFGRIYTNYSNINSRAATFTPESLPLTEHSISAIGRFFAKALAGLSNPFQEKATLSIELLP